MWQGRRKAVLDPVPKMSEAWRAADALVDHFVCSAILQITTFLFSDLEGYLGDQV